MGHHVSHPLYVPELSNFHSDPNISRWMWLWQRWFIDPAFTPKDDKKSREAHVERRAWEDDKVIRLLCSISLLLKGHWICLFVTSQYSWLSAPRNIKYQFRSCSKDQFQGSTQQIELSELQVDSAIEVSNALLHDKMKNVAFDHTSKAMRRFCSRDCQATGHRRKQPHPHIRSLQLMEMEMGLPFFDSKFSYKTISRKFWCIIWKTCLSLTDTSRQCLQASLPCL